MIDKGAWQVTDRRLEHLSDTAIEMFFGAVEGGVGGGEAGAVLGAVSPLLIRASKMGRDRIARLRDVTMDETNLDLEAIAGWVAESDERVDFFRHLLEAAWRAGLEEKRVALGRVAASAINDDASIEEATLFLKAIEAFEAPHVRVLAAIEGPRAGAGQMEGHPVAGSIDLEELSELVPDSEGALRSVLGALRSWGTIDDSSPQTWDQIEGRERFVVSAFGRDLVEFLTVEAPDAEAGSS